MREIRLQEDFLSAMRRDGLEPDCSIICDGKLHRFRDWLDKPGTKNGWYVLFPDYPPAGAYGCWRRGIYQTWSGSLSCDQMIASRNEEIYRVLAKDFEKGRILAHDMLQQAILANGQHHYLQKKKVGAHGIYYLQGALLIPVRDVAGKLQGLQRIFRSGQKRFTKGSNMLGSFHLIGAPQHATICIAEGYATASTVFEVTGHTVATAFSAGNLLPVAQALRKAHADFRLLICADDDRVYSQNTGMLKGKAAADAVGGRLVWPRFSDFSSRGSDFNDLFLEEGAEAVRRCFADEGGLHV